MHFFSARCQIFLIGLLFITLLGKVVECRGIGKISKSGKSPGITLAVSQGKYCTLDCLRQKEGYHGMVAAVNS